MIADADFLRLAIETAVAQSHDPHTQNGAVLVTEADGQVVWARAANSFPPGVVFASGRLERPRKYSFIEHAERGVIYEAARRGLKTAGATLYCPWFACADCARAIICAGVTRAVGHVKPRIHSPERWAESIAAADQMLREANVELVLLSADLGVSYRFNGGLIEL